MQRRPVRQGDVLIIPTGKIPEGARPVKRDSRGRIVLAEGEATGHAHCVLDTDAELFAPADLEEMADRFLAVETEVQVVHDEHDPITLAPGNWVVRNKREYAPERPVQVMD
jgi:hypothetical protein